MTRRIKITVAYLGGPFEGWQRQPRGRTVQGELERALAETFALAVPVVGAGRTDAGVHAAAQVAHLDAPVSIPSDGLLRGLNGALPPEISVRAATAVSSSFHARKSARGKLYCFRVRWHRNPLPWNGLRCASTPPVGDLDRLAEAAAMLQGRRDVASFTVPDAATANTLRTLHRVRLLRRRQGIDLHFVGEGFLRYQVRRMAGALLEVGWGRRSLSCFRRLLERPTPGARVWTAPARGLTLERVYYRSTDVLRDRS